jgi:rSAM/selenodomain-associated transferase 2/rSAM/selenodomain-associated transferase 1
LAEHNLTPNNKGHERIILFTRYPEAGKVKTRLIPALGPEGSCELHRQLAELAVKQLKELSSLRSVSIEVRFDGGNETLMQEWLGTDFCYSPQGQGDLGVRMRQAFLEAFQSGFNSVVLIGSDCPARTSTILQQAFEGFRHNDLILGPALDGGYYLIGLQKLYPLFSNIPWGSAEVFNRTREKAQALGLKIFLLEALRDIDRPEDLCFWEEISALRPDISIIIPTLNEATTIPFTLARIPKNPSIEVIVADGESHDGTQELAAAWGAKVLSSLQGRARQMNTGAGQAKGRFLLFLHADTLLPEGFADHIYHILSRPENAAGAFQLKFDPPLPGLELIEKFANWRARVLQLPYGDQAIFLRADQFQTLRGFTEIPIMEDVDLIRRLGRQGRIVIAPVPVITSSRRWQDSGVWRTTFKNQVALAAFWTGISPNRLARWYHRRTG